MGVIMKNKVNYTGGGGSGGASALADLEDVELTTVLRFATQKPQIKGEQI